MRNIVAHGVDRVEAQHAVVLDHHRVSTLHPHRLSYFASG